MILKNTQKDSRLLSNYRPISLTNISYKIFASMLQHKLQRHLDPRVRDRQFGFRKNRSTTQPIHITRRLLEVFERQNSPFHTLFIDWSKAFDSVTFTAIDAAMQHMGVPPHTRKVIMALYDNPTFVVRDSSQKSAIKTQTKGPRQGCPLSPYLFGFVLTHLFYDVEQDYQSKFGEISGVFHIPFPLWDLEYADDTVLLSCSSEQMNRLLHTVQYQGNRRGFILIEDKCEHLRLHVTQRIHYAPQHHSPCACSYCGGIHHPLAPVPLSDEIKYLGVYLDPTNSNRKNTSYRVSQAVTASKLLRPLLSHASLPPSWKLTVYRSIVLTIMMYAMDSVLLTSLQIRKLDTVHYKSLRRIFKIKSSYYHRVLDPTDAQCSNQYLASLAYSSRRVQSPSQLYSQQRLQLFGQIHRHPDSIENKSTYMSSHAYRHIRAPSRPGRPKIHWAESCMVQAAQRIDHLMSDQAPPHDHIHNDFFEVPSFQQVRHAHRASGLVWMDNTSLFRYVHPKCQDRTYWQKVVRKPRRDRGR